MDIDIWLKELSDSRIFLPDDGECVLLTDDDSHYVTILEHHHLVVFRYSLPFHSDTTTAYRNALILNANETFLGRASLSIGNEVDTLILSVFSAVTDRDGFKQFWQEAEELRQIVLTCLEDR